MTSRPGIAEAVSTDGSSSRLPGASPVIVAEGVSRRFEVGGTVVTALERVDLRVGAGTVVVVLGPSGSGKTTLLNLLGALDTPSEGRITIAGRQLAGRRRAELFRFRRETVSFVFQTFNLFPGLTALENVQFAIDVTGHRRGSHDAASMLDKVGLGDRLRHFPHQLSGGEQQRVAIARALATGNPVLLADEPTGELDFRTGRQILALLRTQADAGSAVVIVTHNREIARMADKVVELSGGRVVSDEAPPGGPADVDQLRW